MTFKKIFVNLKKNWIIYLISILFVTLVINFRTEIKGIAEVLKTGLVGWIILAFVAQIFTYFFITMAYKKSLSVVGIKRKIQEVVPLVLSVLVVNITTPTAGLASTFLFANNAKKRNESPTKAAAVVLLIMVAESVAFSVFLVFAITYLSFYKDLGTTELISTFLFLILNLVIVFLFTAALSDSKILMNALNSLENFINKFRRRKLKGWAVTVNEELKEISKSVVEKPKIFAQVVFFEFMANAANIISLILLFAAFQQKLKFGIVIAGYSLSYLFKIISPTPEGIGFTEGAMVLVYTSFGLPILGATAISLIFRLINFWIPLSLGFYFFNRENYDASTN